MKKFLKGATAPLLWTTVAALVLVGCDQADQADDTAATNAVINNEATAEQTALGPPSASASTADPRANDALDLAGFDRDTRPQDDLFRFVNGAWLDSTEIPADKSRWGSFDLLRERSREAVKAIIEQVAADQSLTAGSDGQRIRDLYLSLMDEGIANQRGVAPIQPLLDEIDQLGNKRQVMTYLAKLSRLSVGNPMGFWITQDAKNPEAYIVYMNQGGLGLPDRDYYFDDSERGSEIRAAYQQHLTKLFGLAGSSDSEAAADSVLAFETALAEHHWTRVENRNRDKTYNRVSRGQLRDLAPDFAWGAYLQDIGVAGEDAFVIRQPSYLEGLNGVLRNATLPVLKNYLRARVLVDAAEYLSQPFVDADFAFYGKVLSGQQAQEDRWKRAVNTVNGTIGELVGKEYVKQHFPPEAKQRMLELVGNLRLAMAKSIDELEWMTPPTKQQAHDKLENFTTKIGYPDQWRDYSALTIKPDDLIGNLQRAAAHAHAQGLAKLGGPIDRSEWFMSPQTVNAYYNPSMNEIVFPAAILQPPFFYLDGDDAVNYGGIGMVIGHEIGHGFDDQGRKSDGKGMLRDWWTEQDAAEYTKRTDQLVEQYSAYEPLEGQHINGELTLGENIGDIGGLALAWRAYQMSKAGQEPDKIDDFSGDQRFFLNFAQIWRGKIRDEALEQRLKTDSHSPGDYRVLGSLPNFTPFYEAFDVKQGDGMYMPPAERVSIW